jgi:hypothetical protein
MNKQLAVTKRTRGCRSHDRMVVGFTTTYAINTSLDVLDTTLCDKVCQ